MHKIAMLGTGLIGRFYTQALHGQRRQDRVEMVYSRSPERAREFASEWGIPRHTTDLAEAIRDPETDVVVVGLPNHRHREAAVLAAEAGKAVLCTKPLARTGAEAREILEVVERAGVFHGYLEDLAYTPKTLKALESVRGGALGKILWARSRETHPGPHSDWFWDKQQSGGRLPDPGAGAPGEGGEHAPTPLPREKAYEGKYIIQTEEQSLSPVEAVQIYKNLTQVERAFQDLKDVIDMRPIYHQTPDRTQAHIFVAALALLVHRALEKKLKVAGLDLSATEALRVLKTVRVVDIDLGEDRQKRGVTKGSAHCQPILSALGLSDLEPPSQPDHRPWVE